ncbi:protein snail [Teleopsis dalmanni]|uniref:protein snail n=1 Tax=Teleopsis dalmanni TaxID=139649 RepID=UPI0018CEDB59|nr:protein snail [Teleopsis dalmanni]
MATNYKSCPLKKRPIVYVKEETHQYDSLAVTKPEFTENEQPEDLSLKRKSADDDLVDYVVPAKREYVLNLSKNVDTTGSIQYKYRPETPISCNTEYYASSAMLSPQTDMEGSVEYETTNIHLRGLTATTNPYSSAFVMAAGCNPMTALWTTYQPNISNIYPSPASSIASTASISSPRLPAYNYQQITPPSSPGSDVSSEPEDLSVRNDIPLPALFHLFEEAPTDANLTQKSNHYTTCGNSVSNGPALNAIPKNYRFKCEKCNKMYSTSIGLSKHQQFHCPAAECNQEKKQHSCEECGKLYTTIGALKMHIRTHTLPCRCNICGKAFSRPWLLQGHIRTHTGEKPFQCPDCPRSFADRSNLRAHQQTHVFIKKYVCKICNKSFSRMSLLNKHMSTNCTIAIA